MRARCTVVESVCAARTHSRVYKDVSEERSIGCLRTEEEQEQGEINETLTKLRPTIDGHLSELSRGIVRSVVTKVDLVAAAASGVDLPSSRSAILRFPRNAPR